MRISHERSCCGEHIVYIDGITGLSPAATDKRKSSCKSRAFCCSLPPKERASGRYVAADVEEIVFQTVHIRKRMNRSHFKWCEWEIRRA